MLLLASQIHPVVVCPGSVGLPNQLSPYSRRINIKMAVLRIKAEQQPRDRPSAPMDSPDKRGPAVELPR